MKLTQEFIEGYCHGLIDTNENISDDLRVEARVYYVDLTESFNVNINWGYAFDNHTNSELRDYKDFSISNLKDFGFELANLLDGLSEVKFENDYNSKTAKLEFHADDL